MSSRVCPNCHAELGSYDRYFCSCCGEELPDSLVLQGSSSLRVINREVSPLVKSGFWEFFSPVARKVLVTINAKDIFLLGVAMLTLSSGVLGVYFLKKTPADTSCKTPVVTPSPKPQVFGADSIAEYIPADVDVYFEGQNFSQFIQEVANLNNSLNFLVSDLAPFVAPHFAYFSHNTKDEITWGLILFPSNEEWASSYDDLEFPEGYYHKAVGDAVVLSNSETILNSVYSAKERLIKPLSLRSQFVTYFHDLPKSGQYMLLIFSEEGKMYLDDIVSMQLPDTFDVLLKKYQESNSNYVVL